jgi:hypothetical protein
MRKCGVLLFLLVLSAVIACAGGSKGESCSNEGKIGGDCKEGLLCSRSQPDGTGPLICLVPCDSQVNCQTGETCNGDRGRDPQACRPNVTPDGGNLTAAPDGG